MAKKEWKIEKIEVSQEIWDSVLIQVYGSLEAAKVAIAEEEKYWCSCTEDHGAYYVPDDVPGAICEKHHWCCNKCHLLKQVG